MPEFNNAEKDPKELSLSARLDSPNNAEHRVLDNHIPVVYCIEGSTIKLQKMTGENDNLDPRRPVNNTESQFGVTGADLGTPVEVNNKIYFLFGDTILSTDRKIGNDFPAGHFFNEDSIAWTISTDPEQKVSLEFVNTIDNNGKKTYVSPMIYNNDVPLPAPPSSLQVPTGGFSANSKLYAIYTTKNNDIENLFKGNYDYNSVFLALKKDGINLTQVKEADANWSANGNDFWIANWEIMWKSFLVSTDGIDPEHSIVNNNIKFNCVYPLSNIYNKIENLDPSILRKARVYSDYNSRTIDNTRIYLVLDLDRFSDFNNLGKFIHVSAIIVDNSSIPGLQTSSAQVLLIWGIGLFRRSNPFLAYIPLAGLEQNENIRYYAGREAGSHRLVWSESEQDAIPLFDHPVIGEFNVSWNSILGVWIMLYNNDTDPPFLNKPATFIQFRTSLNPWGPWSEPRTLFDPGIEDEACNIIYYQWKHDCNGKAGPDDFPNPTENGNPYAPFVISRYTTRKGETSSLIYYIMSTWRPYNTAIMRSELTKSASAAVIGYTGNPVLIQSTCGIKGNFEVLTSFGVGAREPRAYGGGGSVHFFRNNDHGELPWSNFTPITTFPPAEDSQFTSFENLAFIQSNFGSDNLDNPANFEIIGRIGDRLKHVWRESKYPFYWKKTNTFLQINNSFDLTGVSGNPCLIQSTFGDRHMNFELVVPVGNGGFYHLFKVNDGNNPGVAPWQIGNNGNILDPTTKYLSLSLIQSNYNRPLYPGNLELVARYEDKLAYFWMDSSKNPPEWNGPLPVIISGVEITGIIGIPSFIQSTFGQRGNFELAVPLASGGFMHYSRNNDAKGDPQQHWRIGNNGKPISPETKYKGLSLIQGNFRENVNNPGNLEAIALSADGLLFHFWMNSETKVWGGPYDLASF